MTHWCRWSSPLAALAALTIWVGCGGDSSPENPLGSSDSGVTASRAAQATASCKRSFVRSAMEAFIEAADSGSAALLDTAIADEPAFRQFSHGLDYRKRPQRSWRTKAKSRLVSHLETRAARGDRWRLVSVRMGSPDRSFRVCNMSFVIWRKMGDLSRRGERFIGKGAVSMDGGIAVWNTGAPERHLR